MYIKGIRDLITHESIPSESFLNTTYFHFYNDLISNKELNDNMMKNEYTGILCLHPNFAALSSYFTQNKLFKVKDNCKEQELFAKASLLITDYSSIFLILDIFKNQLYILNLIIRNIEINIFQKDILIIKKMDLVLFVMI